MKKVISYLTASAIVMGVLATAAPALAAGSPNQMSCFGRDRAAYISANSGREAGAILAERAGDNAAINSDYRDACQAQ